MAKLGMRPETAAKIAAFRALFTGKEFDRFTADKALGKRLGKEFPTWQTLKKYGVLKFAGKTQWHFVEETWADTDELYNVYVVTAE